MRYLFSRTAHETFKQYLDRVEKTIPGWNALPLEKMADGFYVPHFGAYVSMRK